MVVCVEDRERVVGVQTTILTPGGRKADIDIPRRTLGRLGDGAVRLAAPGAELGLAEGVETALTAMELSGIPCWASLSAGRMHKVAVPAGVPMLHIFADADEPGRTAAKKTAEVHTALGRVVKIHHPPVGYSDFNELTVRRAA
jgi:phage/plasmid primase-like uncharacterized protein